MTGATLQEGQADLPSTKSTNSFWHREPSPLLGHRTTPDLPSTADVVIVGSGITGTFAAKFLKSKWPESKIVMLEAREACWGATGRNGGHCQPNVYALAPEVSRFEVATYKYLRDFTASNDIPCDWQEVSGVHAYETPDLFAQASRHLEDRQRTDPDLAAGTRLASSPGDLSSLLVSTAVGAVEQPAAASLWPYKLVTWVLGDLLARFSASGKFNLQTTTPVTHIQRLSPEGWVAHTPRGQIAARHVILCTNAHTSRLLPCMKDLIVPVRGQVAALAPRADDEAIAARHSYVFMGTPASGPSQDDYLIQRPVAQGGQHIFGGGRSRGTLRGVGISADDEVDPVVAGYLRRTLAESLDLDRGKREEMRAEYEWTGTMGFSRDGHPWVGGVPEALGGGDGLWVSAAYTGHGMPQAALCGEAVADMLLGGRGEVKAEGLVQGVRFPDEFRITEHRVHKAREMEGVREMDAKDMFI